MVKAKILIVESNLRDKGLLEVALKKAGFSVATTSTPEEALSILDIFMPDLIISNTRFPKMDGFEFCKRVKENPKYKHIPFIFLTPDKSLNSKIKGLELGADDYLVKPLYLRELVMRVKILVEKKEKESLELVDSRKMFTGSLEDMGLVDLIQTMELGRKTGIIYLYRKDKIGKIYFSEGRLINAVVGDIAGEEAVYRLFTWNEGTFKIEFRDISGIDELITSSTQAILMEGMRRLDEIERYKEQLPPFDTRLKVDNEMILESNIEKFPREVEDILVLFDGKKTLGEILDEVKIDQVKAVEIISKLYFEGFLTPVAEDKEKTGSFVVSQFDLFEEEETEVSRPPEIPPEELFKDDPSTTEGKGMFELAPPEEENLEDKRVTKGPVRKEDVGKVIPFPATSAETAPEIEKISSSEKVSPPVMEPPQFVRVEKKRGVGRILFLFFFVILLSGGGIYYYYSRVNRATYEPPESLVYSDAISEFLLDTEEGYRNAEKIFKKLENLSGENWKIKYFLSLIHLRWGELKNDEVMIDRGWEEVLQLKETNDNPFVEGAYAEALMIMGKIDDARHLIQKMLKNKKYYQFYYVLGDSYLREYDTERSRDPLIKSVKLNPRFVKGLAEIGKLYFMKGDFTSSITYLNRAIQLSPEHVESLVYLGRAYYRLKKYNTATSYLIRSLSYRKDEAVMLLLSKIYVENLLMPEKALSFLKDLWFKSEKQLIRMEAGYLLGKAYIEMGQKKKGIRILRKIYNVNPGYRDVGVILDTLKEGMKKKIAGKSIHGEKKKPEGGVNVLSGRDLGERYLQLGIYEYRRDNYEMAYQYLSNAMKLMPDDYRVYYALGRVLEDMGRVHEAIAAFLKVVYLNPSHADAHLHLGGLYYSIGRTQSAIKEYRTYLQLAPNGAHAEEVKRILRSLGG